MARRIRSFTPRTGRPALYPWARWTDGSAWHITRGEDFELPARNMAAVLRARATKAGLSVTCRVDGDSVRFQFGQSNDVAA